MQTLLNDQNITEVKHNTKTYRLINILWGRLHSLFQQNNLRLSDICRVIPRLYAGDFTMYQLKLLTSPEGYLPTPTPNPKFFYANKGFQFQRSNLQLQYICSSLFPCFECIRKSTQFHSSYPACTIHPNFTYPILTPIFHFSLNVEILEKRNKFWQFIQQVEYILTCQIQSSPQFPIFSTLETRGKLWQFILLEDNIITYPYPIFTPICLINSRKTG